MVFDCLGGNLPPPYERNTALNKGRKYFHCLGAPNNLIGPCLSDVSRKYRSAYHAVCTLTYKGWINSGRLVTRTNKFCTISLNIVRINIVFLDAVI